MVRLVQKDKQPLKTWNNLDDAFETLHVTKAKQNKM
jgi:hypothetical protein